MSDDEQFRLSSGVMRAEIERQMGRPVHFRCQRQWDQELDGWRTEILFESGGHGVAAYLSDDDRGMAVERFGERIVAAMVARWKAMAGEEGKA